MPSLKAVIIYSSGITISIMLSVIALVSAKRLEYHFFFRPYVDAEMTRLREQIVEAKMECMTAVTVRDRHLTPHRKK